jgi:hypothetical protein
VGFVALQAVGLRFLTGHVPVAVRWRRLWQGLALAVCPAALCSLALVAGYVVLLTHSRARAWVGSRFAPGAMGRNV